MRNLSSLRHNVLCFVVCEMDGCCIFCESCKKASFIVISYANWCAEMKSMKESISTTQQEQARPFAKIQIYIKSKIPFMCDNGLCSSFIDFSSLKFQANIDSSM